MHRVLYQVSGTTAASMTRGACRLLVRLAAGAHALLQRLDSHDACHQSFPGRRERVHGLTIIPLD